MEYRDYYQILGVKRDASDAEIKRAYRKLARANHPDVNKDKGAEQLFRDATEAFEVLKDPEKRAAYDQLGRDPGRGAAGGGFGGGSGGGSGGGFRPPPGWDEGFTFRETGGAGADPGAFSDFFETLFRQAGGAQGGAQGRAQGGFRPAATDQHALLELEIEDAYTAPTRQISLSLPRLGPDGSIHFTREVISVRIPKGVTPGQQIRLPSQDGGDIFLEIAFRAHPVYRPEGRDIHLDLPVTPWEAALGGKVRMPTPSGTVDITIPKGARTGQKLRLKGRGIPVPGRAGDLFATLQIVNPPVETAAAKDFYNRMAREFSFDPRRKMGV